MRRSPEVQRMGEALRERRRRLGLRQVDLCDLAGLGPAFLYELEHGKATVRLDKVLAVLRVLGLSLELREGSEPLQIALNPEEKAAPAGEP